MQFDRHERVRGLIAELAATFIRNEANPDPLITVTGVRISPDYRNATVLFTTIPDEKQEDALIFLKRKGGDLRGFIKKQSNFKIIPHLTFEIDYGERHRQHIDEVVRRIEDEE